MILWSAVIMSAKATAFGCASGLCLPPVSRYVRVGLHPLQIGQLGSLGKWVKMLW